MDIADNDVFHFRYHPLNEQGWDSRTHCFEGLLIARRDKDGNRILADTFWGSSNGNTRVFTLEEAEQKGTLTHYCNFDKVEAIGEWERDYFDDGDLFLITQQHGCIKSFYKRLGATRSKEKMLSVISGKIREAQASIRSLAFDVERYTEIRTKINLGDTNVYL